MARHDCNHDVMFWTFAWLNKNLICILFSPSSFSFSQRVTALNSDNGKQLTCHAKNPALFWPVESTMTMSVYCECLIVSVSWQSKPPLLKKTPPHNHRQTYKWTHNNTRTQHQGGPRVTSLVRSVCVSGPRETFNLKANSHLLEDSMSVTVLTSQGCHWWAEIDMTKALSPEDTWQCLQWWQTNQNHTLTM